MLLRGCRLSMMEGRRRDEIADEGDQNGAQHRERGCPRGGMIVGRAVGTLVAAAHLTNVENVEFKRFDDRLVESLWCVVIVDADGEVSRHIRYWVPALKCEMNASVVTIQTVKVKDDFVVEEFSSSQIANPTRQNVLVQHLQSQKI